MKRIEKLIGKWWKGLITDPTESFGLNIVVIGGGTGLSTLLRGLKKYSTNITAIVTMSDDGASTGKLRSDLGVMPYGDIRKCLVALADEEPSLSKLFDYRFKRGNKLNGHNFGNLFLAALEEVTGSFEKAVIEASRILNIHGQVYPSTLYDLSLGAILENGQTIWGESKIPLEGNKSPIRQVFLKPKHAEAYDGAVKAIQMADLIIIGPGSLYTSILPNLLIEEIAQAIQKRRIPKIFICNVSTERGETENYSVDDHLLALEQHLNSPLCDYILVNNKILSSSKEEGKLGAIRNITTKKRTIGRCKVIKADIICRDNPLHHDPNRLASAVLNFYYQQQKRKG